MFVNKTAVHLATAASPVPNNLALQISQDANLLATTLAVIQDNFINVIPILSTSKHAKYIPISQEDRCKGCVKQVQWVNLCNKTFFVVASTEGLQVYDSEACDLLFYHAVREIGDQRSYAVGICVLKTNILVVGTHLGTVWMFKYEPEQGTFTYINRVYAHDEAILMLEGSGSFMVSTSAEITYLWCFKERNFDIIRKFVLPGMMWIPTSIKFKFGFVLIGYRSGEFCIFDMNKEDFQIRVTAHKLQITGIDFSGKFLIASVSDDCYLKIWRFEQETDMVHLQQAILNEDGPLYGVGFLNYTSSELCCVTGDSTKVNVFIHWEENIGDTGYEEELVDNTK